METLITTLRWLHIAAGTISLFVAPAAMLTVNFDFLPTTARWLWATVVGTLLIAIWITYYRRRFRRWPHAPVAATRAGEVSC